MVKLPTLTCPTGHGPPFYSKFFLGQETRNQGSEKYFANLLTTGSGFGKMGNCSARQSAYRAGGGKISEAGKNSLKRKLSSLSQMGDPAFGGRQSSLTIELSMPRQSD
jgi:hypothetical protein